MKVLALIAAAGLVAVISSTAEARGGPGGGGGHGGFGGSPGYGASQNAPGQEFRTSGPINGYPGASGYAPGHQFTKHKHNRRGASTYAPGYYVRH